MFKDVQLESNDRILQTASILRNIKDLEKDSTSQELAKLNKGIAFVSMYASIEYTITQICFNFLSILQNNAYEPLRYKQNLLCIILDSKFKAIMDCSPKNIWTKKSELITCMLSSEKAQIDNTAIPVNGFNIGIREIQLIWHYFHLPEPIFVDDAKRYFIDEIKNHRNAISHGRKKASEVGKRYSLPDIEKRHTYVSMLCSHVIATFDSHTKTKSYLG